MLHLLLIGMLSFGSADKISAYRGQPVVSVSLEAPESQDHDALKRLIGIEPGYILSTFDVQKAIKRLFSLGRFENVNVYAKRLSGAVMLHFELVPIKYLGSLVLNGLDRADPTTLRRAIGLRPGSEFDSQTPRTVLTRARRHLIRSGFPDPKLRFKRTTNLSEGTTDITLDIDEGPVQFIDAIEFAGTPRLSTAILEQLIESEPGDILNQDALEADRQRLLQAYLSHGFRAVEVDIPTVDTPDGNNTVKFRIHAAHRISIEFVGNTILSREQLLALWPKR